MSTDGTSAGAPRRVDGTPEVPPEAPEVAEPVPEPVPEPAPEPQEATEDATEEATGRATGGTTAGSAVGQARRRRGNPKAAALIGLLCLLLGFAIAVQVRHTGTDDTFAAAREEDLVGILDDVNARQERLRQEIAEQRATLQELTTSGSTDAAALQQARDRVTALGILNGTIAAHGPGLVMTIRDPAAAVRVADVLDVLQELRNAGAETMQIDGIRVGVSSAVTGDAGSLKLDGQPLTAPYEVRVIGSPDDLQTAMNIPGGVVSTVQNRGGSVEIQKSQDVVVDALRPLDQPQYAAPQTGGG